MRQPEVQIETSRREQRIGYAIGAVLALCIVAWLAWITWGARNLAGSSPEPTNRGERY